MQQSCVTKSGANVSGVPDSLRYLARQPILDVHGHVYGYELLFRDGAEAMFRGNGETATRMMIDNTVLFGLQDLAHGLPAFVNCTAEILTGDLIRLLPPAVTVLEILETIEPTADVVAACHRLKAEGYRLAMDDFLYRPELEPLVRIADYIKIDFLNTTSNERVKILSHLAGFKGTLLAEKVERPSEFAEARREGFELFQGYYFCQPLLLKQHKVPTNRAVHLQLLQKLQHHPLEIREIGDIVKSEPSLTYRLLRYVNSAAYGLPERVTSIHSALLAIGDDLFRRIAILAVASELNSGHSTEILRMALVRARFCESTSLMCRLDATEQYLVGLFSLLPAMLQTPMEKALASLPLPQPTRQALLGTRNAQRCYLDWLEFQERGEFEKADALATAHGLDGALLSERFTAATVWADRTLA